MQSSINEELNNYLHLSEDKRTALIKKLGLHKDINKIAELPDKLNISIDKKTLRILSEDTMRMINQMYA